MLIIKIQLVIEICNAAKLQSKASSQKKIFFLIMIKTFEILNNSVL